MERQRIEFIDLAKGVCIILVVLVHCGVDANDWGMNLMMLRMPLYFVLSGLFFKSYGSFKNLCIKKINKLLIPFLTFFIIGVLVTCLSNLYSNFAEGKPLLESIFRYKQIFKGFFEPGIIANSVIWFLLVLFWCNLIFYFVSKLTKKWQLQIVLSVVIGSMGYFADKVGVYLPFYIGTSLTALPFFSLGYVLKNTGLLYPNRFDKYLFPISLALFLAIIFATPHAVTFIDYYINSFKCDNVCLCYAICALSVVSFLLICKRIGRVRGISYLGKYSIIILCTHMLFRMRILPHLFNAISVVDVEATYYPWLLFFSSLALSILCIPLCLRYIPSLVAQRDLIELRSE